MRLQVALAEYAFLGICTQAQGVAPELGSWVPVSSCHSLTRCRGNFWMSLALQGISFLRALPFGGTRSRRRIFLGQRSSDHRSIVLGVANRPVQCGL